MIARGIAGEAHQPGGLHRTGQTSLRPEGRFAGPGGWAALDSQPEGLDIDGLAAFDSHNFGETVAREVIITGTGRTLAERVVFQEILGIAEKARAPPS